MIEFVVGASMGKRLVSDSGFVISVNYVLLKFPLQRNQFLSGTVQIRKLVP